MTEEERCSACGATFVMRPHHRTGKLAPITTYEVENGNVFVSVDGTYGIIGKDQPYDGPRYVSHFADCPEVERFVRTKVQS